MTDASREQFETWRSAEAWELVRAGEIDAAKDLERLGSSLWMAWKESRRAAVQGGRFIAVIHGWHVYSNGFSVVELQAKDRAQAQMEASHHRDQREGPFDSCAVLVVELNAGERLARRLTWMERITGKLKP